MVQMRIDDDTDVFDIENCDELAMEAEYQYFWDNHGYVNANVRMFGCPQVVLFYSGIVNGDENYSRAEMVLSLGECMGGLI